jgi:molecular chaperone GrpE
MRIKVQGNDECEPEYDDEIEAAPGTKDIRENDIDGEVGECADVVEQLKKEIEKLRRELDEEKVQSKSYFSRLQHLQADFENYQKMVEKNNHNAVKLANERLIVSLLPILDSFERALCDYDALLTTSNANAQTKYIEGIHARSGEFLKILECNGLKAVDALNEPFDPSKHEAIQEVEDKGRSDNMIIEELRKGYTLNGVVIRPAMVKVSRNYDDVKESKSENDNVDEYENDCRNE